MGTHIQRAIDLFKKENTADHFDTSGEDTSGQKDTSDSAVNIVGDIAKDFTKNLFKKDTASDAKPKKSTSDWIWFGINILLCVMFAVFTANSMIFVPWPLRLVTFLLVLFGSWISQPVFIIVSLYYIGYIFTSMYKRSLLKEGDPPIRLLPKLYAFLPLRTAKGPKDWGYGFLNVLFLGIPYLITYFGAGEEGSAYQLYKFDETDYIESIKQQIPDWNSIKNTLGVPTLLAEFIDHLDNMNITYKTDASGNLTGSTVELPESTDVGELLTLYNETTKMDDFKRRKILDMLNRKLAPVDTERLNTLGDYIQGLMKEKRFGEAIAFSRILLGKRQATNKVSKESDQARSTLLKALMAREKEVGLKVEELTKQIATDKANGTDVKKLELEKTRLEQSSNAIREEIDRLGQKVRSASITPAYDLDGKDLSREITNLIGEINALMSQEGGSNVPSVAAVGTDKMASIAAKFAQLNEILDANEAIDWAELSSAKENIQRLRKLQSALQKEVGRLRPLKESSADVLQNFNLKTAELAGAEEDVEHALKQISDIVPSLYNKAKLYEELQKKLDAKAEPVFKDQANKLEARRKPIEELYGLVSPPADAKTNLDIILSKIPSMANVSKVTFTEKNDRSMLRKATNAIGLTGTKRKTPTSELGKYHYIDTQNEEVVVDKEGIKQALQDNKITTASPIWSPSNGWGSIKSLKDLEELVPPVTTESRSGNTLTKVFGSRLAGVPKPNMGIELSTIKPSQAGTVVREQHRPPPSKVYRNPVVPGPRESRQTRGYASGFTVPPFFSAPSSSTSSSTRPSAPQSLQFDSKLSESLLENDPNNVDSSFLSGPSYVPPTLQGTINP
jgi:hypothetical protein